MFQKKRHQATILGPTQASHQECPACLALMQIASWLQQLDKLDVHAGTEASLHHKRLEALQGTIEKGGGYDPAEFHAVISSTLSTPTGTDDFLRRQFIGG